MTHYLIVCLKNVIVNCPQQSLLMVQVIANDNWKWCFGHCVSHIMGGPWLPLMSDAWVTMGGSSAIIMSDVIYLRPLLWEIKSTTLLWTRTVLVWRQITWSSYPIVELWSTLLLMRIYFHRPQQSFICQQYISAMDAHSIKWKNVA